MTSDEGAPEDITTLLREAEQADAATHLAESLSNEVSESFCGAPSVPRTVRYATLEKVRALMWQTRLDEAEALVAPYARADLGFMLSWTEIGLWRAAMTEKAEQHDAVRARIAVLDAHATAAFDRLHPERASRSASTLGWLTGQAAPEHPSAAALSAQERSLAFVDAALVGSFAPLARALLDFRTATAQGIVTGGYYLRKAWKSFEYAHAVVQKEKDTDEHMRALLAFVFGAFQLSFSMVPPSLKWLVELVGFRGGDRSLAYKELGIARRNPIIQREAILLLSAVKFFFHGEKERAERWIEQLRNANPESPLIMSLSGTFCRAQGKCREALTYYERALSFKFDAPQFLSTIHYHYGMCQFVLNDWAGAAEHLAYFLENTKGKVFRPYAAWRLGVAYWHLKKVDLIAPLYEKALGWLRPHEAFDQYAEFRIKKFLAARKYDALEELLDAAEALHEGHEDRRALELLDQVAPLLKSEFPARDNFAMLFYLKGACLRRLPGQSERAQKFLRSAIGELNKTETKPHYAVAYALVNLGELLEEEGKAADARKAWEEAKQLRGFMWERMLTTRINADVEKLERKSKQALVAAEDDLSE
jgi:tetratricopeptide (TPR) repeat protein